LLPPSPEAANLADSLSGHLTGAAGNRIAWEQFAGGNRLAVLFSHGGGQSGRAWRRAASLLDALGHPCLIYDQRGHGQSEWIERGDYALDDFRDDLLCVIEHWATPCVLVGSSLGGLVSMMAAATQQRHVRGLVMIDTAPQLNLVELERIVEFLSGAGEEGFESVAAAASHMRQYFPERPISNEAVEPGLMQLPNGRWQWRWDVRVILGERNSIAIAHEERLHECARQVGVPFLLLRAEHSTLVTDSAIERLERCVPQLEVGVLVKAAHIVGSADASQIVSALRPFIDRCASVASSGAGAPIHDLNA
jgi:pimeloyl-ACP methyl ester carboxylesterase